MRAELEMIVGAAEKRMRETRVVSLIAGSASPSRLLFSGRRMGLVLEEFSSPRLGVIRDKVMAGGTPANPATLVLVW